MTHILGLASLACIGSHHAVGQVAGTLSPIPAWPRDGKVPKELADRYVFYDAARDQWVVTIPARLDTEVCEEDPGRPRLSRMDANRGTRPRMSFSVVSEGEKFVYTYRLENGAGATRRITSWNFVLLERVDGQISSPTDWRGVQTAGAVDASYFSGLVPRGVAPSLLSWYVGEERATIAAGSTTTGFRVTANHRPGIIVAYVKGGFHANGPRCLPEQVENQLGNALTMAMNSQNVLTVGPKFSARTPRVRIAEDYFLSMNRLIDSGQLRRESPAVREALAKLASYPKDIQPSRITPFVLSEKPASTLESQLLGALLLAMN